MIACPHVDPGGWPLGPRGEGSEGPSGSCLLPAPALLGPVPLESRGPAGQGSCPSDPRASPSPNPGHVTPRPAIQLILFVKRALWPNFRHGMRRSHLSTGRRRLAPSKGCTPLRGEGQRAWAPRALEPAGSGSRLHAPLTKASVFSRFSCVRPL